MTKPKIDKEAEKKALETIVAYRQVFNTPEGQAVLDDLIKRHMLSTSMSQDPATTAFKEGERNVVLKILATLNIDETKLRERMTNVNKT